MPLRRVARHTWVPVLTAIVMAGILSAVGREEAAARETLADGPPSLESAEGNFDERPLAGEAVTATAPLTVSIVPEKVRLRFGAKAGSTDPTADVEAARPPATRAPRTRPSANALLATRLAERAGRCSAPSTAPPVPTT